MNFNIYVEDHLAEKLDHLSQQQGKKRNAVIREALEAWITQNTVTTWPEVVMNYQGDPEAIAFESYRDELIPPTEASFSP